MDHNCLINKLFNYWKLSENVSLAEFLKRQIDQFKRDIWTEHGRCYVEPLNRIKMPSRNLGSVAVEVSAI
jgi:hypothetical protein